MSPRNNLGDYVSYWAKVKPEDEALVHGDRRISYREFDEWATRIAASLEGLGVRRGDRVAVELLTLPEYVLLYMGIARLGAVMVGVNPLYTAEEAAYLLQVTRPAAVFTAAPFLERLSPALEQAPVPQHVLLAGEADGWLGWEAFLRGASTTRQWTTDADDPVLIVFTSGTTGKPKGAVLSHRSISSNIEVEVQHFGLTSSDRMVLHLPMNHVGGATEMTMGAIIAGATLVVLERFHPQKTLELVQKERVTFLGQVPTMFIMELNLPEFKQYDLSSLKRLAVAGAPTPTEVMRKMMAIAPVVTGYGMTEAAGFVTYTEFDDDPETVAHTVGRIAAEFEMRIGDTDGGEVPAGEIGEVLLRGNCLMQGYYGDAAATREALTCDGWYRTGDMGFVDARGYLTLAGRKKEMFISGGYNVYPPEIEESLSRHPGVLLAACVGVPDSVFGEVGKAYVVPKPGTALDAEELKRFLAERLASYKVPRHFEFRESLAMTALGKVDKKQLK